MATPIPGTGVPSMIEAFKAQQPSSEGSLGDVLYPTNVTRSDVVTPTTNERPKAIPPAHQEMTDDRICTDQTQKECLQCCGACLCCLCVCACEIAKAYLGIREVERGVRDHSPGEIAIGLAILR